MVSIAAKWVRRSFVLLIWLFLFLLCAVACGDPEQQTSEKAYDFSGEWYSTRDGFLYVFSEEGNVFCDENHVTLSSGKKTSGNYLHHDLYIDVYVIDTFGADGDVAPLYLVRGQQTDMLCADVDGSEVIFCRDAAFAQDIVQNKENRKEQQAEQEAAQEKNEIFAAPTLAYDTAISGDYTYQFVGIEGFVTSYTYSSFINWYNFNFWVWSDQQNSYICRLISVDADEYTNEDIDQLLKFDDGDKVRISFEVKPQINFDDWIDLPRYLCVELIEEGDITEEELSSNEYQSNENDHNETSSVDDIDIRFEYNYVDGDRLHLKIFTKNNSEEIFSGNIYITFYSGDGKDRLGSDTIIVDELLPGRESWANITVHKYSGTPEMTATFSDVSFVPVRATTTEIDIDATENTKSSYYWNFDGVSWYTDIIDITVYTDKTCVVTVGENPKEDGQFYAATIWSCGKDHGVKEVQVIDTSGKILAVY